MMPPSLFDYPDEVLTRRHAPRGYVRPEAYKAWLRDEFRFRCVYCLERETWYPDRAASFSIEHIRPLAVAPALALEYGNLAYACTRCNSAKQHLELLNPTEAIFAEHVRLGQNGLLIGVTDAGRRLINTLRLNVPPALEERRKYLLLLAMWQDRPTDERLAKLCAPLFGYPHDMPDLRALRPPGGNANPGSEDTCYFARAERGELPATY